MKHNYCILIFNSYIAVNFFWDFKINSVRVNTKLNVALTFNVKPEEIKSSASPQLSSQLNSTQSYNDTYAEWDTMETIDSIKNALELFHNVTLVEANEDAFEKLRKLRPDIVFNFAEGAKGISREAQIPALLDMLGIPYTGSDPLTLITCLDKSRTKEILTFNKIANPKFVVATSVEDLQDFDLTFPVIVKPVAEGSSKGIFNSSFVSSMDELKTSLTKNVEQYKQPFIIEEYLPGREFTVAILGSGTEAEVLPIVEINFNELPDNVPHIYSFEAKWIFDTKVNPLNIFTCPAQIDNETEEKIRSIALKTYKVLRCKDWSRIDIRLDANKEPNIIEVNPIPGVLPDPADNSCFPKAARAYGLTYEEMINKVLLSAAKRNNLV